MNSDERLQRNKRIAEIARENLERATRWPAPYMNAYVVQAVEQARRAEYYERLEALGQKPREMRAQ